MLHSSVACSIDRADCLPVPAMIIKRGKPIGGDGIRVGLWTSQNVDFDMTSGDFIINKVQKKKAQQTDNIQHSSQLWIFRSRDR